jgi:putative pyruvate formate lyase activating enzyme
MPMSPPSINAKRPLAIGRRPLPVERRTIPPDTIARLDPMSPEAEARQRRAQDMLLACEVCPRLCGVARLAGEVGVCRTGHELTVASWNLHHGEEPPISGTRGSGTIFLSGCSLRCRYCQNYPISQLSVGKTMTLTDLVRVMLELEADGAHNINFVTPTHHTPALITAILAARRDGLQIPIVWNTSGYERVKTLRLLDGLVDVYLADMRYAEAAPARRYSQAADYPTVNRRAISEMHRQVGTLQLDEHGVAQRGLLIRHLVLPDGLAGSRVVFEFLAQAVSRDTAVSVMSQYFPAYQASGDKSLGRRLTHAEYAAALEAFTAAGLSNGYCQEF